MAHNWELKRKMESGVYYGEKFICSNCNLHKHIWSDGLIAFFLNGITPDSDRSCSEILLEQVLL